MFTLGINVKILTGEYDVELQLWKSKSSQLSYAQKRRYYFPELEKFRENLSESRKKEYKEQIYQAIINIADKYREECRELKLDMDLNSVFHPDVNAHRVHCIYLMKLHRGLVLDEL